jgi:hypothetical protein
MRLFYTILPVVACLPAICQAQLYGDYSVRVEVEGNGYAHLTDIIFEDESWATYGYDLCCDAQMLLGNSNQPHIYTKVVSEPLPPLDQLSINYLPLLFEPTDVSMGFLPGELSQYTFTFKHLWTIPEGVTVELEDQAQSLMQDLLLDSTYVTWGAVSDPPDRFIIHFYPDFATGLADGSEMPDEAQVSWVANELGLVFTLNGPEFRRVLLLNVIGGVLSDVQLDKELPTAAVNVEIGQLLIIHVMDEFGNNWTQKTVVKNF